VSRLLTRRHVTARLDVVSIQDALDALVNGDERAVERLFTDDLVFTGVGGCFGGRTVGIPAVLDRFAEVSRKTDGTFGTEVETVYAGRSDHVVVVARHWAVVEGRELRATQALLISTDGQRLCSVESLGNSGPRSGLWD
jgi:ketosteroid isomerase-like protein